MLFIVHGWEIKAKNMLKRKDANSGQWLLSGGKGGKGMKQGDPDGCKCVSNALFLLKKHVIQIWQNDKISYSLVKGRRACTILFFVLLCIVEIFSSKIFLRELAREVSCLIKTGVGN
jgi:hypothetical protein